jgi:glutamate/aspartate transport system substrate-binding protein
MPTKFMIALTMSASLTIPAAAQQLGGTLQKIREAGAITLGFRESQVPFSYLDNNQKPVGYGIDICLTIVEAVKKELALPNLEVRFNPETPSTRIPLLANGTIDLECGSATNNLDRQKQVDFTNTNFVTQSRFVAKKSSGLKTIDDLRGKTVVSTSGSSNMKQLVEINKQRGLGMNIVVAGEHPEAFLMVETGRAAAFAMDDILLSSLIASSKDSSAYLISEDGFAPPEPYGIMLRKDDPNFKRIVDRATAELYSGAEGVALYEKWFLRPIPPRELTLNVPMSKFLKKAFASPTSSADPEKY